MMKFVKLNKILSIQKGKKNNLVENRDSNSVRVIQIDDLRNDKNIKYTNDDKGILVNESDILITWDGANVGTVGYGKNGYLGSTLAKLQIKNSNLYDSKYLGLFLKTKSSYLKKNSTGATIPHINRKSLENLIIPIPENLSDQIRIAEVLTKTQLLIQRRKDSIDLLDIFIKSTFINMFGNPIINDKKWEKLKLNKITKIGTGSTPSRSKENEYYNGNIFWVKTTEVKGNYIYETSEKITELAVEEGNCRVLPVNTILLAMYGQGKTRGNVGLLKIEAATNQACATIPPSKKINQIFLYQYLKNSYLKLRSLSRGGNQENLNLNIVGNFEIFNPPIELQNKFALIAEKTENLKDHYLTSLKDLENLFDSLSQRAFKGDLNLSAMQFLNEEIHDSTKNSNTETYQSPEIKLIASVSERNNHSTITPQMQEFIRKTSELEKIFFSSPASIESPIIYKNLSRQIEVINRIIVPIKKLPRMPESVSQAMKTFEKIKSLSLSLQYEKKSVWYDNRGLNNLVDIKFNEIEGLAVIEEEFSKMKGGFTFQDFEQFLKKEKFKYTYNQLQQFIFKLLQEKKLSQNFWSNNLENRLQQQIDGEKAIFYLDESIWFIFNTSTYN